MPLMMGRWKNAVQRGQNELNVVSLLDAEMDDDVDNVGRTEHWESGQTSGDEKPQSLPPADQTIDALEQAALPKMELQEDILDGTQDDYREARRSDQSVHLSLQAM